MRRNFIFLSLTVLCLTVLAVDSVITEFTVTADNDKAILEWQSGIEGNLTKFKIERSIDGLNFTYIFEMFPTGNFSEYQFIDDNLYKTTSQRVYYYRIKMIFADGTYCYSEVKSVTIILSGLMETWGSIKAMFR